MHHEHASIFCLLIKKLYAIIKMGRRYKGGFFLSNQPKVKGNSKAPDTATKIVFKNPERFADIFNKSVFKEELISPDDLREKEASMEVFVKTADGKDVPFEQHRDVAKMFWKDQPLCILGIENQTEIDYHMPYRVLLYDALNYAEQAGAIAAQHSKARQESHAKVKSSEFLSAFGKDDKLLPVVTLVVYYGTEKWDGPRSLSEMFQDSPLKPFANDYQMHLLDVCHLEDSEIEKYSNDLRILFGFVKRQQSRQQLNDFLMEGQNNMGNIPTDIANAMTAIARLPFTEQSLLSNYKTEQGGINMCKAWTDMQTECERRGEQRGEQRGEERGRVLEAFDIYRSLPDMNDEKAIDQIMKKHNLSREEVERYIYGTKQSA